VHVTKASTGKIFCYQIKLIPALQKELVLCLVLFRMRNSNFLDNPWTTVEENAETVRMMQLEFIDCNCWSRWTASLSLWRMRMHSMQNSFAAKDLVFQVEIFEFLGGLDTAIPIISSRKWTLKLITWDFWKWQFQYPSKIISIREFGVIFF